MTSKTLAAPGAARTPGPPHRLAWVPGVWDRHRPAVLFAAALLVRIAFIIASGPTAPPVAWGDDRSFDISAQILVTKHQYYNPWYPLGYPLFLAAIYLVFGQSWLIVRLIQAVLGAVTCVLVYRLGRRIFTEREGVLAALALAVYPGHVFFSWRLMAEVPYMTLLVLTLVLALALAEKPRPGRAVILGLVMGCAQLVKTQLIFLPPLLMVWFALAGRAPAKQRVLCMAAASAGFGLTLCVAPIINLTSPGERTVTAMGIPGTVLWRSNNPVADGYYVKYPDSTSAGSAFIRSHGYEERLKQAGDLERERLCRELALMWVRENPGKFAMLCLRKLDNAFAPFPRARIFDQDARARLVHVLTYGLAAPFALIGMIAAGRRWRAAAVLYLGVLSYVPTVLIFYGTPRFTLLIIPILLLFSSHGAVRLFGAVFRGERTGVPTTLAGA